MPQEFARQSVMAIANIVCQERLFAIRNAADTEIRGGLADVKCREFSRFILIRGIVRGIALTLVRGRGRGRQRHIRVYYPVRVVLHRGRHCPARDLRFYKLLAGGYGPRPTGKPADRPDPELEPDRSCLSDVGIAEEHPGDEGEPPARNISNYRRIRYHGGSRQAEFSDPPFPRSHRRVPKI